METALITGASMGLGEEFARQLAARGVNLLLTARSRELLEAVAADARQNFGVRAEIFPCDLALPDAAERIAGWVESLPADLRPNWLINNAGFGEAGPFGALPPEKARAIATVNVTALTELTARLLPALKDAPRGTARIINLGSLAAFQPIPYFAVYAATKAYVLSLSEALAEELGRTHGIRVTCVCPGPVRTRFGENNGIEPDFFEKGQSAPEVVSMALRASDRGQVLLVTASRLRTFATRLAPRPVVRKVAAWMVRDSARKAGRSLDESKA